MIVNYPCAFIFHHLNHKQLSLDRKLFAVPFPSIIFFTETKLKDGEPPEGKQSQSGLIKTHNNYQTQMSSLQHFREQKETPPKSGRGHQEHREQIKLNLDRGSFIYVFTALRS